MTTAATPPLVVSALSRQVAAIARGMRLNRGWSQAHLASLTQCAPATITVYERGQRNLTFPLLERLAVAFQEEPVAFFLPPGPVCPNCLGAPAPGFTCNRCGHSTPALNTPDLGIPPGIA